MNAPLYPYQNDVLGQMEAGAPTYLGFDPGLGKSRTAIEAARRRHAKSILIICPASGRYVWERECKKWWPEMPFDMVTGPGDLSKLRQDRGFVLITYGLLSQKDSPYANVIAKHPRFDMTILDEAAAVKNPGANRTKAILGKMLPKLGYLVPMSGTPAPNHAGELYPILKALHPHAITDSNGRLMDQWLFEDCYCRVVRKRFGGNREVRVIEGSRNLDVLRRRMEGFMQRVKKEDVLKDLPPIRWDIVPLRPDPGVAMQLPALPPGLDDDELLAFLSGATGEEHVMRLRHYLGIAKVGPAVEYLQDFLENLAPDRKILVFAHHKDVIAGLQSGLGGSSPAVVTGATNAEIRTLEIDRFLTDPACRVFIGNIQAAGTGLTLVGPRCKCADVFFVEADYSVGNNVQAAARVHRIGQKEGVVARMLTAHGTIDDRIQDILARKASDFQQLFD